MNWFIVSGWAILITHALGTILDIANIGKEREPITPEQAAVIIPLQVLVFVWIYVAITGGGCH